MFVARGGVLFKNRRVGGLEKVRGRGDSDLQISEVSDLVC